MGYPTLYVILLQCFRNYANRTITFIPLDRIEKHNLESSTLEVLYALLFDLNRALGIKSKRSVETQNCVYSPCACLSLLTLGS
jgi:hypothetical protein